MRVWQIRLERELHHLVSDVHGHENLLANKHKRLEWSHTFSQEITRQTWDCDSSPGAQKGKQRASGTHDPG